MMLDTMPVAIERVLAGPQRGSSRPVVAATSAGRMLVKLRGAAQGTGPLIAEMVAAALAETLELPVPPRCLVNLDEATPTDDKDDELADLLSFSTGLNLAFPFWEGARDAKPCECLGFTPKQRAMILWLDRFVLNPDRTMRNPNILVHEDRLYLIDYGSALGFQYNWKAVTEESPIKAGPFRQSHLFENMRQTAYWWAADELCRRRITRSVLEKAVAAVPDAFLAPLPPQVLSSAQHDGIYRRRAAYVAFLWKRLKAPREFARA